MVLLIILLACLGLFAAFGFYLAGNSTRIHPMSLEDARKWQADHYDISWYDGLEKADYEIVSFDGYVLHAQLLKNPSASDRYVICSHGYTDNRFGTLKYARLYLDLGYHVVIYDLRGHGLNAPTFCTYSARESRDLLAMIADTRRRYPGIAQLGIHGESLGASTSVAALKYKPDIDFVVADCGFSEISSILKVSFAKSHAPGWLVNVASVFAKVRYGYSYADMRPIDALSGNRIPILFMHGDSDGFIPPSHSEAMAKATAGYAEIHLVPGAKHAASVLTDPGLYRECLDSFLNRIGGR